MHGILSLVGQGYVATPLPDEEIEWLRTALQQRAFEPHSYLSEGTNVRIKASPLSGGEAWFQGLRAASESFLR